MSLEGPAPLLEELPLAYARRWLAQDERPEEQPGLYIFVRPMAYLRASVHACSDLTCEVGGVLVGRRGSDPAGARPFIVVETVLPARFTDQGAAHLTFTSDSLVDIHDRLEKHYPGLQIVGWYHTHPRMAVFLSHYDTWLHRHFFPEPWQVALVIEPVSNTGGFFVRPIEGELDSHRALGFFEMTNGDERSVVRWRNLTRAPDVRAPGGN